MPRFFPPSQLTGLLLAGAAVLTLSACASPRSSAPSPDFSGLSRGQAQSMLSTLAERYRANPKDRNTIVYYSAALRAAGQAQQAVSVIETGIAEHGGDVDLKVAYAKALAASGRFPQALSVVESAIRPESPDWNALSVKGAILDQSGRNGDARIAYKQALTIAPDEASLYANLGLSYAMTNELDAAEQHLRKATTMRDATSQIRQNLALVVGLQGRFEECRALFTAELPPPQVEANMAYIRALLTQQNRWREIEGDVEDKLSE